MKAVRFFSIFGLLLGALDCPGAVGGSDGPEPLEVGFARVDITPSEPYPMAGYFSERLSQGVIDPLHAKAIVLRQGSTEAALVICDLVSVSRPLTVSARLKASSETGIPFEHLSITATHTHTGPDYYEAMREFADNKAAGALKKEDRDRYVARLVDRLARVVGKAYKKLRPSALSVAEGGAKGISFNRRFVMADGRVRFNPGQRNPRIVKPAGPIDPSVPFLLWQDRDREEAYGSLTAFANHLDTVGGRQFSSDYPYYLTASLKERFGKDFVSVFGLAPCGDINHIDVSMAKGERLSTELIGNRLAAGVKESLTRIDELEGPDLAVRSKTIFASLQEYTDDELEWARGDAEVPIYPERSFLRTVRKEKIRSLHRMRQRGQAVPPTVGEEDWTLPLRVHAFRLHPDVAIVTLPGEVFVELGLALKEASPFQKTILLELANSNIAYVPTQEAFREGSYETLNSRIASGEGERLVEAAVQLLDGLASNGDR